MEEKRVVPDNQTGFRKRMGTMGNIYVMNYLINRQLGRKRGKMMAMFVDLKAAFDSVDRRWVIKMKKKNIREGIVQRVEEVLRDTKSRVRMGGETG